MLDLHHGKEIYIFFGRYEINGIIGLIISSMIFSLLIFKILKLAKNNDIENYDKFLKYILKDIKYNEKLYEIVKVIINIFLLGSFYIMVAGLSSYFKQKYNITNFITATIGVFVCYIILKKNIDSIVKISTICVPILIIFIIGMGIKNMEPGIAKINKMEININYIYSSILNSILYAGYNSILVIPIVISLKKYCKRHNELIISFLVGATVLTLGFGVFIILLMGNEFIMQMDMPIEYILKNIEKNYTFIYGIVIIISIMTSIISAGYSFLKNYCENDIKYNKYLKLICISSVVFSNVGFSNLINLIYPIFGFFGIIQIYLILRKNRS